MAETSTPDPAQDPVEILAESLATDDFVNSCAAFQDDAWYLLNSLREAGWRIVRTETSTLDQSGELYRITEEWTAGE
jgi:hypothetical protein